MGTTKMPTPIRPKKANGKEQNVYWIRKKVPLRYRQLVGKTEIWRSLGTANLREANARIGRVSAEIEAEWARLADGAKTSAAVAATVIEPRNLSNRDLHALRGVVHVTTRDAFIDHPSVYAKMRLAAIAAPDFDNADDMEALDDAVREFLGREGFCATDADVARFTPLFVQARVDAVDDLWRAAAGDYSDNPVLAKLPARTTPKLDLLQAFEEYTEKGGLKGGKFGPTAKRWRPKIKAFCRWLGHRDLARVTPDDGIRYMDHLLAEGFAAKSVRDVWLASLKATAGFMVERRQLKTNPFLGIRVRGVKESKADDEKAFSDSQAKTILTATLATPSHLMSIEMKAARRWVPWLCAYSGARVNEITSLTPTEIQRLDGHWSMIIRADLTKADTERRVPIHRHVLEQENGEFLRYVEQRRRKCLPLFYDPARSRGGQNANPHFQKVAERIAEWVRGLGVLGVAPNHGWRHRFKSVSRDVFMHPEVANFITGHGGGSVSERYGSRWIRTAAKTIAMYPRYQIAALDQPAAPHKRVRRTRAQIAVDEAAKAARKARRATRAPDGGVVAT
jgi:integrase